jgi:hypothetical protein
MDGLTRSSSARAANHAARGSVVLALLGIALPVVAFGAAHQLDKVSIVQATIASCGAVVLGGAAVLLGRRGLRNIERTLGRVGGEGAARVGRLLGVIALCIGLAAAIAIGVYAVLNVIG